MERLILQSEAVDVQIVPAFGARVTALFDRRTGRDWLVGGALVGSDRDDAAFLAQQARGWDECFPTVAACHSAEWGRDLRDHGDLWARGWQLRHSAPNTITCQYNGDDYQFRRTLTLEGATLSAHYSVTGSPRPFLYSQHMLLATRTGEQIVLQGVGPLSCAGAPMDWPGGNDCIAGIEAAIASKAYGAASGTARASVTGPDGAISIGWSAAELPYFGLWRCFGGWPAGNTPVHQLALEPTSAPADDLAAALAQGAAPILRPDDPIRWTITVSLSPTSATEASP